MPEITGTLDGVLLMTVHWWEITAQNEAGAVDFPVVGEQHGPHCARMPLLRASRHFLETIKIVEPQSMIHDQDKF